jgi:hypothetical protein
MLYYLVCCAELCMSADGLDDHLVIERALSVCNVLTHLSLAPDVIMLQEARNNSCYCVCTRNRTVHAVQVIAQTERVYVRQLGAVGYTCMLHGSDRGPYYTQLFVKER